jgi:DNA polymerase-3 subunit alpha
LEALDRLVSLSSSHHRMSQNGQMNLFGGATVVLNEIALNNMPQADQREMLGWEKELLGLYVSSHPLLPYWDLIKKSISHTSTDLEDAPHNLKIMVGGMVSRFRPHQTKTGKWMGFVGLEDLHGIQDLTVFPSTWEKYSHLISMDNVILVDGRVDKQNGDTKIIVDRIRPVDMADTSRQIPKGSPSETEQLDAPIPLEDSTTSSSPADGVVMAHIVAPADMNLGSMDANNANPDDVPVSADADTYRTVEPPSLHESPAGYAPKLPSGPQSPAFILPPVEKFHLDDDHPHMLIITLRSSGEKRKDVLLMRCIHGILVSSPGRDRFAFQVFEGDHFYCLEFPNETTGINQMVMDKLQGMLGIENIHMEQIILH